MSRPDRLSGSEAAPGAPGRAILSSESARGGKQEDRTFKLDFVKTSEYGRYVKSLWEVRGGLNCSIAAMAESDGRWGSSAASALT